MKSHLRQFLSSWLAPRKDAGLTWSDPDPRRPHNEGPPDLEEQFLKLTRFLRSLLPGRIRAVVPGGGAPFRNAGVGVIGIAAALVLVWLASGVFQVQEGSVGVVLQFGAYKDTRGAGIWFHWPYPIQSVETVSLSSLRSVEIGRPTPIHATNLKDSSMLTADENIIDVRFAVQYRIKDAKDYLFNNARPEETVVEAAETSVREIVGRSDMDYVFGAGRAQIESDLQVSIQKLLDAYGTGIAVTSVTLQQVQPPEQVQAAFDDAVKASQDRERQKNEGQAYANDVIPRAKGDAARVLEEAEGYRAEVVTNAAGDAERFKKVLAEYAKAPAVTRERMYLQTMQDVLSHTSKVLIDSHGSNIVYLPLDKLTQDAARDPAPGQARSSAADQQAQPPATPVFPSAVDAERTRDPTRSREREQR
jgi:membrane protease subunit HflK